MFSSLFGSLHVDISLEDDVFWVYPGNDAAPSANIRGRVALTVPTTRRVESVKVELEVQTGVMVGSKWRTESTMLAKADFALDQEISAGRHCFDFSFVLAAEGLGMQRSAHGAIRHYVKATVTSVAGLFRPVASTSRRIFVTALQTPPGDVPDPFDFVHEHHSPELGPLRVEAHSPHLTVGALLHLRLRVSAPPTSILINSVQASVIESTVILPLVGTPTPPQPPDVTLPLTHIPNSPTSHILNQALEASEEWNYEETLRIPDCISGILGWTTLAGTDSKIVLRHTLAVHIISTLHGVKKSCMIQTPVIIASCIAMRDSLALPTYAHERPDTEVRRSKGGTLCICEFSGEELVEKYGAELKATGRNNRDEGVERPIVKASVESMA